MSTLQLKPEDETLIYNEIDEDSNKTVDKNEMVLFFEILMQYEQDPNYEKLKESIRS